MEKFHENNQKIMNDENDFFTYVDLKKKSLDEDSKLQQIFPQGALHV